MKGFKIDPLCEKETKQFMRAAIDMLGDSAQPCDIGSLHMLMLSYDMYIKASKQLLKDGPLQKDRAGRQTPHPAVSLTKSYWTQVATYMRELGLTIKSREHIKALTPPVDENNPLAKFLKSNGQ